MKRSLLISLFLIIHFLFGQENQRIITTDIDNFWIAYDSIQKVEEYSKKMEIINTLYIDKGTEGLKDFMKVRSFSDSLWVKQIEKLPKFWNSIRNNTITAKNKNEEIEKALIQLKKIYPQLKESEIYFTIGNIKTGGTIANNKVLIGCEVVTGNSLTDISEFNNDWIRDVFKNQNLDNIVYIIVHEYIHIQQKGVGTNVLTKSIKEGACDFIAELVLNKPIQTSYMIYGIENELKVKNDFIEDIFTQNYTNWLYNRKISGEKADLGYFIGFKICEAYYNNSINKSQAIKEIIELDYSDLNTVENFLKKSNYFQEEKYKEKKITYQPYIIGIEPFNNGDANINPSLKELKINFSEEMIAGNYSINYSKKGKEYFPIVGILGFCNNDKTLVIQLDLKPNKEYEFLLTDKNFKSKKGYKLKENFYLIKFKTK